MTRDGALKPTTDPLLLLPFELIVRWNAHNRFTAEHADNPSTIKMQDSTLNPGLDNNNYKDKRKNHDEHSVSLGQQQRNFAIGRNRSQSASFISDRARDTAADTTLDATQDSNSMLPSTFSNSQRRVLL